MNSFRDRQAAIKKLRLLVFSPKSDVDTFRAKIEDAYSSVFIPNHVESVEHDYGGVVCDQLIPDLYASRRIMLYVHGGSFAGGSRASWRPFVATLANAASCRAVVPELRLPPAHAFPSALEDIQTTFRALYTEEEVARSLDRDSHSEKEPLPEIIVAADGSGASLAVALMLSLRGKFRASVKQLILLSPWLDLSQDSPVISGHKVSDDIISGEALRHSVELYTYPENCSNPLVSPLKAPSEDFAEFPPVFIQMGAKEVLLPDAQRFKALLEKANVPCTLDVWPDMMHLFQMADEYLEESHRAVEKIGELIASIGNEDDISLAAKPVAGINGKGIVISDGTLILEHSLHADA